MNKEIRTRLYIIAFSVAAVLLGAVAVAAWPLAENTPALWLIPTLVLLVTLAGRFSVILSRQADSSLFTVPIYMAALLMHPAEAAAVGALGTLLFQLMLRRPGRAVAFNTSMAAVSGGLGGMVFFSLRPEGAGLAFTQEHIIAAVMAGMVLHVLNIIPVVGIITVRKGREFWLLWADSYVVEVVVEGILLSLGLIAALLVTQSWWGLALMVLPSLAAYHVLKRTVEYAAKKGMLAEELESRLKREVDAWQGLGMVSAPQPSASTQSASAVGRTARTSMRSLLR